MSTKNIIQSRSRKRSLGVSLLVMVKSQVQGWLLEKFSHLQGERLGFPRSDNCGVMHMLVRLHAFERTKQTTEEPSW